MIKLVLENFISLSEIRMFYFFQKNISRHITFKPESLLIKENEVESCPRAHRLIQ